MPTLSECTHEVRVVYFEDGKLFLVDQKVLPVSFTVRTVTTLEQTWEAIKDMTVRGAPAIGAAGAFGLVLAARASSASSAGALHKELLAAKAYLDSSRPTAVNLAWATGRILDIVEAYVAASPALSAAALAAAVEAEAQALAEEDVAVNRALAKHGAEVVPQNANILHHCNTGALATVDIGTALGVIYECHAQKKNVHVWVDETRPRLQGARLTAWELQRAGVPLHLIVDSAAGMLMAQKRVDCFLFGADRVAANGDVANKVGTFKNCVVAWELGVATYACVPTSTVDLTMATGGEIHIEERSAEEVTVIDGVRVAPEGVPVYNPAFDVTPAKYITGIITEEGVCYRPFEVSLRKAKKAAEDRARIAWKAKLDLLLGGAASS